MLHSVNKISRGSLRLFRQTKFAHLTSSQFRILRNYRVRCYLRIQSANVFVAIFLPRIGRSLYQRTLGQLEEYSGVKKKRKTFQAGLALAYAYSPGLTPYSIKSFAFFHKGLGNLLKGFSRGFRNNGFRAYSRFLTIPLAHNGTRRKKCRRL